MYCSVVFFFKQKTAYEVRISDWSSDVCSSDLLSDCSSGKEGGNLGQITRGSAVPEFETFLFNLEVGQICPLPIKSRFGFHIARLDHRIEGRQLPFEVVKDRIAAYMAEQVWRRAIGQYVALLIGQAEIRGIELQGAISLLVQ